MLFRRGVACGIFGWVFGLGAWKIKSFLNPPHGGHQQVAIQAQQSKKRNAMYLGDLAIVH
eukprot:3930810-Amphidinium_carterae.1